MDVLVLRHIYRHDLLFFYEETKYKQLVVNSISQVQQSFNGHATTSTKENDVSIGLNLQVTGSNLPRCELVSNDWIDHSIPIQSYRERHLFVTKTPGTFQQFARQLFRPLVYIYTFPAVAYNAIQYGSMLSWFAATGNSGAAIFSVDPYDFGPIGIGLLAIRALIGTILGGIYGGIMFDWAIIYLSKRNNGVYEPEFRLYMCIPPAFVGPAGVYLYGIGSSSVSMFPLRLIDI